MDAAVKRSLRTKIYVFFTQKMVYHSLFWITLFLVFIAMELMNDRRTDSALIIFSREIVNVLFFAIVVYFNFLYLIPNYLTEKKFSLYCFLLVLSVVLITPIKILVISLFYHPEVRSSLIDNQIFFFITSFFFAGASTIYKIVSDWARHQREKKDLQTQTMQSELKFLKSQINPHFLFNTLNNLYALTLKKSDKAPEIVIKLSEMMRYMLYECNEKRVLLSKEVHYIKNYLDLEMLRQGKNVDINFDVQGTVSDQRIAPLMFIPFLENSFKHGLNNSISTGYVNIKLVVNNQDVNFYIENSKAEKLPSQDHRRSGGIGLVNVRRRLNILYSGHYLLDIKDNPKSYAVNLKIELDR